MLRNLCRKAFILQSNRTIVCFVYPKLMCQSCSTRSFPHIFTFLQSSFISTIEHRKLAIEKTTATTTEVNPDILKLQNIFQCTTGEANKVHEYLSKKCEQVNIKEINKAVKWLRRIGATKPIILENFQILSVKLDRLKSTYEILKRSQWKQTDDLVPLLKLNSSKIRSMQMYDRHVIRDRIYLFQEYFSIEPHIIGQYCVNHLFLFEIELALLKRKLDMLNSSNVSPDKILRDLNVLARAEDVIKERLEFINTCGIRRVMPWMIKCEDRVLHRFVEIRNERGKEQSKTLELLADRLNWHGKTAISMYTKNECLHNLDYDETSILLNELLKVFSPSEITANLNLLSHPVSDVKIRVAELLSLDKETISPNVLKMSEKRFSEFVNNVKNK